MNAPVFNLELVIDSFSGGGGASEGIRAALGRDPDIAINHDAMALAMHRMNHPGTHHIEEDVVVVDSRSMCGGRPVGMLWMSPDCKHHSKAKGGKPRDKNIRGLAWTVFGWVKRLLKPQRPRVVFLENVEEFQDWGPLLDDGRPCPVQRGAIFRQFVASWEALGYVVEWRELRACDFGVPTIRKRLYLIARRDGEPIVWPEPTHGDPKSAAVIAGLLKPWVAAATIIDWSLPCPSIFDTSAEIKAKYGIRAIRPLAEATMARIAKGTMRYVVTAAKPFVVQVNHGGGAGGRDHRVDEPGPTMTGKRGEALVTPFVSHAQQGGRARDIGDPLHTLTASRKDQDQIVTPHLMTMRNAQKPFNGADEPTHTLTAGGAGLAVVAPVLVGCGGRAAQSEPRSGADPLGTQTAKPDLCVAAVHLSRQFGASVGSDAAEPVGTITAGGAGKAAVVAAFLAQHNSERGGGIKAGSDARAPVSTITAAGGNQNVVAAHLTHLYGSDKGGGPGDDPSRPLKTDTADGRHAGTVCAFLAKYYGEGLPSQAVDDPLHTVTAKPRHGLVTVAIEGEPYFITDIGMRMLTPRERFSAQGFRRDYEIDRGILADGTIVPFTLEQQGRFCGNSVCPEMARVLVAPNFSPRVVVPGVPTEAPPLLIGLEAAE